MLAGAVCLLAGCFTDPRERPIGQAYAGPASMPLRKDLSMQAELVSDLKHGERLEILQFRRRFVKVRNLGGGEGWVDSRSLLTQAQMDDLRTLAQMALGLPSQGRATVYDTLNVHLEPNRNSPSPYQIAPNEYVEIVAHAATQRVAYKSPVMEMAIKRKLPIAKKPKKKQKDDDDDDEPKDAKQEQQVLPPPLPSGPKPPMDWLALSRVGRETGVAKASDADDWSLVRITAEKAGWVLSRNLQLGLPDNLLKQANGHRIMAALPLGDVEDEGQKKTHWLWATINDRLRPYQFDSVRLFAYSLKRHRMETVLWEKEIRGFYPLRTEQVQVTEKQQTVTLPGFSIITEAPDGSRWKSYYAFSGMRAKLIRKEPMEKPWEAPRPAHILYTSLPYIPQPETDKTIVNKVKDMLKPGISF